MSTQPAAAASTTVQANWKAARAMLVAGAIILAISLGIRHAFGLFLQPISMDNGWGRETFALAIALQNLVWGISQPFTGMVSDRIGAGKVIIAGALLYIAGLLLMSMPLGTVGFMLSAGVLIGLGLSGTTFPIVFGAISRAVPAEKRSLAMGMAMSVGSFGQFVMLPGALGLMNGLGWQGALIALSCLSGAIVALAAMMMERRDGPQASTTGPSAGQALRGALAHRGFWLLSLGFFACGFQVVFIAVHLPAFLGDRGLNPAVATTVLALIGLVNIAGTYFAGLWGGRYPKPRMLVLIYLGRAAAIAAFVYLPISAWSAYAFGITMGLFWLSTVPLTNGIVASLFGVKNMSMLGGLVFFMHQVGSFLGGWLGGLLYDRYGSYDAAWAMAIGLSVIAALLNWPIEEKAADVAVATGRA